MSEESRRSAGSRRSDLPETGDGKSNQAVDACRGEVCADSNGKMNVETPFSRLLVSLSAYRSRIARIHDRLLDRLDVKDRTPASAKHQDKGRNFSAEIEQLERKLAEEMLARKEADAKIRSLEEERQTYRELRLEMQSLRKKAEKVDVLSAELKEARERLDVLLPSEDPDGELEDLRRRERALVIKVERLRRLVSDLQKYADENTRLKERIGEQEKLSEQVKEFQSRIQELEGRLIAGTKAAPDDSPDVTNEVESRMVELPPYLTEISETVSGNVEMELEAVLANTQGRIAVIADQRGLSLAEAGEPGYSDELAAISSLAESLANQGRSLVPLGPVTSVEIQDAGGTGLFVKFFRVDDESMGLVLYGKRHGRILRALESSVSRLSGILAGKKDLED